MSRRTLPASRAAIAVLLAASLLAGLGTFLSSCGSASTQPGSTLTPAPPFSGVTLDGKTVTLDGYRGKPLFLVYMTSG